ncbi:MAG TPA: PilN domain-containing protein, partial [Holophaga sp.]|nr:PilN domain-containing protein [Holophaga sp.]
MGVPTLKLDLAPPSTLWRVHHALLGWAVLGAGALLLGTSLALTVRAYSQASRAGQMAVTRTAQTRLAEETQARVLEELRTVDVAKELPKWRLAERIFTERSLPWSRLTAELERSMVPDVRFKSLQRTRGADLKVQIKVRGEARTRDAEADLVASLQKNPCFDQIILEREAERNGGGVDFEFTLSALPVPPPYTPLPKFGPQRKAEKAEAPAAQATR